MGDSEDSAHDSQMLYNQAESVAERRSADGNISDIEDSHADYFQNNENQDNLFSHGTESAGTSTHDAGRDGEEESSRPASAGYVEYTGGDDDVPDAGASADTGSKLTGSLAEKPCPVETTLWMSVVMEGWDQDFISKAFEHFGFKPINIKIINEKNRAKPYAFVEFDSAETAKAAILKVTGRSVPNDPDRNKFHLSFANLPNKIIVEYCLAVSNLSSVVTDVDLFKLFGNKYASCRGAKVHVNSDGKSKCIGIIKFTNQTDQQLALVEMNKYNFKGKELHLRLAAVKHRGPQKLLNTMHQQNPMMLYGANPGFLAPGLFSSNQFNPYAAPMFTGNFGNRDGGYRDRDRRRSPERSSYSRRSRSRDHDRGRDRDRYRRGRSPRDHRRRSRSRERDRKRRAKDIDSYVDNTRAKMLKPPTFFPFYVQESQPWSADEYNEAFMDSQDDMFTALESAKWSQFVIPSNWKQQDVVKELYSEILVDSHEAFN